MTGARAVSARTIQRQTAKELEALISKLTIDRNRCLRFSHACTQRIIEGTYTSFEELGALMAKADMSEAAYMCADELLDALRGSSLGERCSCSSNNNGRSSASKN